MFDVFYIGKKPGLFAHEQECDSIDHAIKLSRTRYCWIINYLCDYRDFDFLWEPPPWQAHQRHAWPSQWQKDSGTYLVPLSGFLDTNYRDEFLIKRLSCRDRWQIPEGVEERDFDFSWHPDPAEPSMNYQFGTQHQATGGPCYVVSGAQDTKFVDLIKITKKSIDKCWIVPEGLDVSGFDFTWHPDDRDPPYIYQFGTQHQVTGGPRYTVPGASEVKYVYTSRAHRTCIDDCWSVPDSIDRNSFDFTWHPDDRDPPYIYQFGTQHQVTGGPRYTMPGATEVKYVPVPRACKITQDSCWIIPDNMNHDAFDWTWHPDDREAPYRYQFPTQWNRAGGPEYRSPGATDIKFVAVQVARMLPTDQNWTIPAGIDINSFDFSWTPDPTEPPYIYEFGTQWQKTGGPCYMVPGATERKYITQPRAVRIATDDCWQTPAGIEDFDYTWHPDATEPPYIYEFGTQWQKTGGPRYVMPGATEIKYVSALRCRKIAQDPHWQMPHDLANIIDDFDWTWHPDATEQPYIYEFGSQHQKTGGPEYHVPGATERKYVDQVRIKVRESRAKVVIIDHIDGNADKVNQQIVDHVGVIRTVRYVHSYLDTLKRIAAQIQEEWIWIVSSVCDYQQFDFTWYPEQWQSTMLHVFASDDLKFGDTFFMHVPTFRERAGRAKLLEWYDVNFVDRSVPRRPVPIIQHIADSHVDTIRTHQTRAPITLFTTEPMPDRVPAVNLWRPEVKAVIPLDVGAGRVLVPREAISEIHTQLYDYAYIDKTHFGDNQCAPLDIVFISNGEANADANWAVLLHHTQGRPNRCVRVDGVNGRAAAYHAAANASRTAWFFAVFAKLEVLADFNWSWQPDRMQQPKHYIFHALNPVNMLEYGHQAMIAYNKKIALANPGRGLDFTLDDAHEVVPVLSGVARYNVDPWTCWRTAFREVIKLRASLPDVENEYRMKQWLTVGFGSYGEFSCHGAQDALDFYDEVGGDPVQLRQSYEWSWLASYALLKRNLEPGQR